MFKPEAIDQFKIHSCFIGQVKAVSYVSCYCKPVSFHGWAKVPRLPTLWISGQNYKYEIIYRPFGITPGSMKVARVKLAKTKNVMKPWYAGTHGCL